MFLFNSEVYSSKLNTCQHKNMGKFGIFSKILFLISKFLVNTSGFLKTQTLEKPSKI